MSRLPLCACCGTHFRPKIGKGALCDKCHDFQESVSLKLRRQVGGRPFCEQHPEEFQRRWDAWADSRG